MIKRKHVALAVAIAVVGSLGIGSAARAASILEIESNDTFSSATQGYLSGGSHTDTLSGSINPSQDVDIWQFDLIAGTSFSASVASQTTTSGVFDLSMVLIDSAGYAWSGNDGNGSSLSLASTNNPGGTFYLAVASFANEALDAFGNPIREDFWWRSMLDPDSGTQFVGFSGNAFGAGDYSLSVASTTVPLPPAIWLLGSGMAGLGLFGRRSGASDKTSVPA